MKTIKVSEATNIQLDWLVWVCAGGAAAYPKTASGKAFSKLWHGNSATYVHPTTDWAHGGPIIEREKINLEWWHMPKEWHAETNEALRYDDKGEFVDGSNFPQHGPTLLIAAARCYVASKMGEEVEVPEELA
mgnify:CR=1 FL=1